MKPHSAIMIVLLAGVIVIGGIAKSMRYAARFQPLPGGAEHAVAAAFSNSGWHWDEELKPQPADPYPWMVFVKKDCPHDLTVSILGSTLELQELVDLYYDGEVAYVQNGRLTNHPTRAAGYWTTVMTWFGAQRGGVSSLPLLAVSPIPDKHDDRCAVPFVHRI